MLISIRPPIVWVSHTHIPLFVDIDKISNCFQPIGGLVVVDYNLLTLYFDGIVSYLAGLRISAIVLLLGLRIILKIMGFT